MAGYDGRSGSNFSQYINELNPAPQPYNQDFLPTEDLNLDQELALFTNTDFTDFDNLPLPEGGLNYDVDDKKSPDSDTNYEDLVASATSPTMNHQPAVNYYSGYPPNIQPAPSSILPQNSTFQSPISSSLLSPDGAGQSASGQHRSDTLSSTQSLQLPTDQHSRIAAEEDKRRRNTAASARFRVKKKQREQALERNVREVTDKNTALEAKIQQLETENKWLKDLITEKNGQQTKEEIAEAYQKFRRASEEPEPSQSLGGREGIGIKSS